MKDFYIPRCSECVFFKGEDANGFGGCELKDYECMRCDELCDIDHTKMRRDCIIKGLHVFQKWHRDGKGKMPQPYVVGKLIDSAIYRLRTDVVYDY